MQKMCYYVKVAVGDKEFFKKRLEKEFVLVIMKFVINDIHTTNSYYSAVAQW